MASRTRTNEGPGVRCQVRYVRSSASKAREVLKLIRGQQVARALETLEFNDRAISKVILKGLESAVANAEHEPYHMPSEELYVSACFADEGPTLKRWRPRARGRATRIRKRTCHITIVVDRLASEELERLRQSETSTGRGASSRAARDARRERVARSRQAKAERKAEAHDHDHDHDEDHDHEHEDETVVTDQAEATAADETGADETAADETAAPTDEVTEASTAEADGGDADPSDTKKDS